MSGKGPVEGRDATLVQVAELADELGGLLRRDRFETLGPDRMAALSDMAYRIRNIAHARRERRGRAATRAG
jgi:hypothetical protein